MVASLREVEAPWCLKPGGKRSGEWTIDFPGVLAIVCDGVGGEQCGEIAGQLASFAIFDYLKEFADHFAGNQRPEFWQPQAWLYQASIKAHYRILNEMMRDRVKYGMATTLTGLWLLGEWAVVVNVGDSRVYRYRKGKLKQITNDQSLVADMLRAGEITPEEAFDHPLRCQVDQVLGGADYQLEPDVDALTTRAGDIYLVCSDGLSDSIDDQSMEALFQRNHERELKYLGDALIRQALLDGGWDNITMALVRLNKPLVNPHWLMFKRILKMIKMAYTDPID